jgi:hypothetical protein
MDDKKVLIFYLIITIVIFGFLIPFTKKTPEESASDDKLVEAVEKVLKATEPGDMIVANGKNNRLIFIATDQFDGSCIHGYQPMYMSSINRLLIRDFVGIIKGDDRAGLVVIPKENVDTAIKSMFGMTVNFSKSI